MSRTITDESVRPRDCLTPPEPRLVAAYNAGRTLARARFAAYYLWLHFEAPLDASLDELRAAARAVVAPDHREVIHAAVEEHRRGLNELINSESAAESLHELRGRAQLGPAEIDQIFCCSLLAPINDLEAVVRRNLTATMDQYGRFAFDLGACVEQGVRRADLYQPRPVADTSQSTNPIEIGPNDLNVGLSEAQRRQHLPLDDYLARCLFGPLNNDWIGSWCTDLRQRWLEMGLDETLLPEFGGVDKPVTLYDSVTQFANQIDDAFGRAASYTDQRHPGAPQPTKEPSFLGLTLDLGTCQVARAGFAAPVDLRSRLPLQLLAALMSQRESFATRDGLLGVWRKYGRAKTPSRGTMDDAISKLETALQPLEIEIENRSGLGWRLANASRPTD